MTNPINHRPLGLTVAIVTLALDQLIKYAVTYPLALKSRADLGIEILPIFRRAGWKIAACRWASSTPTPT